MRWIALAALLSSSLCGCAAKNPDDGTPIFYPRPASAQLKIPDGTRLQIALIDAISTDTNSPGDHFFATLTQPVVVEGRLLVEKGTRVRGRVTDVNESGKVEGRTAIRLVLTDLLLDGRSIPIFTRAFVSVVDAPRQPELRGARYAAAVSSGSGSRGFRGRDPQTSRSTAVLKFPPHTAMNFILVSDVVL